MLLHFRVSGVPPFTGAQVLDLTAPGTGGGARAVPAAGIFGVNAAGKTALLRAMSAMRDMVLSPPGGSRALPQDPGPAAGAPGRPASAVLEAGFTADGIRYAYGFEVQDGLVRGEWLHAYPRGARQTWFTCRGGEVTFPGRRLHGPRALLAGRAEPGELFLPRAAGLPQLRPVAGWFARNLALAQPGTERGQQQAVRAVAGDPVLRGRAGRLLAAADLGIAGIGPPGPDGEVRLRRAAGPGGAGLGLGEESRGTLRWLATAVALAGALGQGASVLVDDFGAGLHPLLAAEAVRMISAGNVPGAQLVFTSRDSVLRSLLQEDGMPCPAWAARRDGAGGVALCPPAPVPAARSARDRPQDAGALAGP